MKVLLLCRYGHLGASSRLRAYQYLPYLKEQGIECLPVPLLSDEYVRRLYADQGQRVLGVARSYVQRALVLLKHQRFDLIWVEKELFPWIPGIFEQALIPPGIPIVTDYDDAVFHRYDQHKNRAVRHLLGDKIDTVMRRSTVVVAGNRYLADRAKRAGAQRIEILPTVVDINRYSVKPRVASPDFVVGWIGTPGTSKYLNLVAAPLAKLCQHGPVKLVAVGAGVLNLSGVRVETHPWSEESEADELSNIDVGIMPLPDSPFERGKCGYKLIQYMASGRPVVASPIGVNRELVKPGVNGYLAQSPDDWVQALLKLIHNRNLTTEMGSEGRRLVEEHYSLQVAAPQLAEIFRSVVKRA